MEWTRGRTIGRGSTATVSVARARGSGEALAVKWAELSKSEPLRREQEILSSLRSPRVISYRGFRATAVGLELFMELAAGGSLGDEIRRRGGSLGDAAARACAREILVGLEYLHSEGVVHCDLKASNVLVTGEGLKIADFGCARRSGHVDGRDTFCGTPAYMAPEVARGEAQGFPADIWALGCTVMEMYTGRVSWLGGSDPVRGLYRVGFSGLGLELPGCVSEEGRDFLGRCLRREAAERWSASQLLEHPFVAGACGSGFSVTSPSPSPRSVLESGVVEFGESSDSGWESGSESPGERVRRLCWGEVSDWAWEEGWVRVRGDWAEVGPESSCCDTESDCCDFVDSSRNCKNGRGQGSASSGVGDWKRGSLMVPSKCTKGHVFRDPLHFYYNELYCFLRIFGFVVF